MPTATALVHADQLARRAPLDIPRPIGDVLTDAVGVDAQRSDGRLRRVPSAGALHPVAIYVDRRAAGWAETVRWHPQGTGVVVHSHRTDRSDGTDAVLVAKPDTTIAKYGDRALLHVVLDVGYALSAIVHAAHAHDVECGPADVIDLRGVSGMPLAAVALGTDSSRPRLEDAGRPAPRQAGSQGVTPREAPNVVVQALEELAAVPDLEPPRTATVAVDALRSRRSACFEDLTRPVTDDALMSLLQAVTCDGRPADVGIRVATVAGVRRFGDTGLLASDHCDRRKELAAAAAGQHVVADVGALVLFTAPPASDLDPARFLRTRLRIAHAGYGLCVRAAGHGMAARPVGGWAVEPPVSWWADDGVIVHGVALGAVAPPAGADEGRTGHAS